MVHIHTCSQKQSYKQTNKTLAEMETPGITPVLREPFKMSRCRLDRDIANLIKTFPSLQLYLSPSSLMKKYIILTGLHLFMLQNNNCVKMCHFCLCCIWLMV